LRQWHHLKQMKVAAKLPAQLLPHCPDYGNLSLPRSDSIIGRNISMQIKLGWTKEQVVQRIETIKKVIKAN
jgi:8-amino-3,8-dideoxy-alpha-D-manno-octulosonate transaminase